FEAALRRSGTFLEAKLASNQTTELVTDLKALLLSLRRVLQENGARAAASRSDTAAHAPVPTQKGPLTPLPSAPATFSLLDTPAQHLHELARQTEGALARLTTVQLANHNPDPPAILIELPVRHEERASILRLRIEQDERTHR